MATLGEFFDAVRIRGLDESVLDDPTTPTSFNATPKNGSLELPRGGKGVDGDQGPKAVPYSWRGEVIDEAALESIRERLEPKHQGWAYRVLSTQRLVYWDGSEFSSFVDAFGGKGPDGPVNNLTIGTVTTGAVGSELVVTITGNSPNQVLNLVVPRGGTGQKGADGRPGPIRSAPDFDNSVTPVDGMVPIWDDVNEKWKLGKRPGPIGPYTIPDTSFTAIPAASTATVTIATLAVPAQDRAYIPYVRGHLILRPTGTNNAFRAVVEVYVGDPSAGGQIVASGYALPYSVIDSPVAITPMYGSAGVGAVPPNVGRIVAAGQAVTIYVRVRKVAGNGSYTFATSRAQLILYGFEPTIPLPVI